MSTYRLGADVVVDVTDEHSPREEVLHYGTVCKVKGGAGSPRYRVSGLPRQWFPAWRLRTAGRPTAEA